MGISDSGRPLLATRSQLTLNWMTRIRVGPTSDLGDLVCTTIRWAVVSVTRTEVSRSLARE